MISALRKVEELFIRGRIRFSPTKAVGAINDRPPIKIIP